MHLTNKTNFRTFLPLNCAIMLSYNSVRGSRGTKYAKEITSEGVCDKLQSKKVSRDNNSQNISD